MVGVAGRLPIEQKLETDAARRIVSANGSGNRVYVPENTVGNTRDGARTGSISWRKGGANNCPATRKDWGDGEVLISCPWPVPGSSGPPRMDRPDDGGGGAPTPNSQQCPMPSLHCPVCALLPSPSRQLGSIGTGGGEKGPQNHPSNTREEGRLQLVWLPLPGCPSGLVGGSAG